MRRFKSLKSKFVRTLLLLTSIIGASMLAIVVISSIQASSRELASVQEHIEEGLTSKGRVIAENHALALRSLTLDNAFLDMQRLVERTTQEDPDVIYGLYVSAEHHTLAYSARGRSSEAAPNREAWRELVPESALSVKQPIVKRTRRLGQELLEFAAPVFGEEHELLGTIRYGLSTRKMQDALSRAQADARTRLVRSVALTGSLVMLALLAVLLLSRAHAVRITRPVGELTLAAGTLAGGDRGVRVKIESGDELEQLGASFNRMVEDLDASYRHLEQMNHTLEVKVSERTAELAYKNRDMRLVLDNVDQGFATLSSDGTISVERSRVLGEWFGKSATPIPFCEYIRQISPDFAEQFQVGWEQLADGFLPFELCLTQLPNRLSHEGRTWSFRYLPFFANQKFEGVLMVVAEITERLAREREEAEQGELMQIFKRLVRDRSGYLSSFCDASQIVEALLSRKLDADPIGLKRALHTLKGNSASMGLDLVAGICHALEEDLANENQTSDARLRELADHFRALSDHVVSFGGNLSQDVIEVSSDEYHALIAELAGPTESQTALKRAQSWRLEAVEKAFQRLADQARTFARRLDKGDVRITIETNGLRVDHQEFAAFFCELTHVIRNAVDHGVESPEERVERSKPAEATISLVARASVNEFVFEIGDDGRGINWEAIARKAAERGLPHDGHEALLDALCHDGVSTRSVVTQMSGRGVGMAALKQRVTAMQGHLDVRSAPGEGTRWIIRLPRTNQDAQLAPARRVSAIARAPSQPPRELARG